MATLLAAVAEYLRETIEPGIQDVLPKLDATSMQILRTSDGVRKVDGNFGRAFEIRHTYEGSLSGTHEWFSALGDDVTQSGAHGTGGFNVFGSGRGWPGVSDMAGGNVIQRKIVLTQGRGALPIPLSLMLADKLDASVASVLGVITRGGAKRFGLSSIHSFWKLGSYNNIGTFVGDGVAITTSAWSTFTLVTGRIRSLYRGLFVNLFTNSSGDPGTQFGAAARVAVMAVNYRTRQFKLGCVSGTVTPSNATTYHLIPRNSTDTSSGVAAGTAPSTINSPEGLVDFHKASGTLYSATIDLDKYPEFSSSIVTTYTGPLTADALNEQVGGFIEAYDNDLDTLVTTQGVLLGFLENIETTQQLTRYSVQDEALAVKAGFMPFKYAFNGRELKIMTSRNCPKGTVWVLKFGDGNYKKYVPPQFDKTGRRSEFTEEVQFVGKRLGYSDDIIPLTNSGALTDLMFMPYIQHVQMAPTMTQAVKLSTFDESIYEG